MKLLRILGFVFISLTSMSQGYELQFHVRGITDTVAYLGYHFGNQKYVQDTSEIRDNKAVFMGPKLLLPGIYFFYSANTFFEFVIDDQKFAINTSAPDFIKTAEVKGSEINKDFMDLQRYNLVKQNEAKELQNRITTSEGEVKENLESELKNLNESAVGFQNIIIDKHKDDFLGKFLTALQKPKVPDSIGFEGNDREFARFAHYKTHYFDNFDLANESLLRSPVYHSVITEYLDKITMQHPDSLISSADVILSQAMKTEATFRYCLVTLSNKFESSNIMGFDKVFVHIIEEYYLTGKASWADDDLLDRLKNRVNQIKPGLIGNQAPSLSLVDTEMNPLDLEHIQAKFIVLYFYDHDCGHCKKKTPLLLSQYSSLKEIDVEVIAVDISTDFEKWKGYVSSNNLTFLNGADPYVRSNFRYEYDIRTTPTVYILDENKTIVGKKIDVEKIPDFINYLSRNN